MLRIWFSQFRIDAKTRVNITHEYYALQLLASFDLSEISQFKLRLSKMYFSRYEFKIYHSVVYVSLTTITYKKFQKTPASLTKYHFHHSNASLHFCLVQRSCYHTKNTAKFLQCKVILWDIFYSVILLTVVQVLSKGIDLYVWSRFIFGTFPRIEQTFGESLQLTTGHQKTEFRKQTC